jgi:hypothetical protein
MASESRSKKIIDLVNIALGLIAWMFPDIPLVLKVLVAIVLVTIAVIAHASPGFLSNNLSNLRILSLWILPVLLGAGEGALFPFVFYKSFLEENQISIQLCVFLGFSFGIVSGLPLALYGANMRQEHGRSMGKEVLKAIGGGSCGGCLIQLGIITITPSLAALSTWLAALSTWLAAVPFFVVMGTLGPIVSIPFFGLGRLVPYDSFDWLVFTMPVAQWLQNAQFIALGFLIGKGRPTRACT